MRYPFQAILAVSFVLSAAASSRAADLPIVRPADAPSIRAKGSVTDSASAAPYELRTESTLDRDALEAAGIRRPSRLAYDQDGNLLVLDAETRRVVKLDPRGRVLTEVGGYGSDETSLELPVDLVVDRDQSLLVLDRARGALVAYDRAGRFLGQKLFQGAAAEEARTPGVRLLLDPFGTLWLLGVRARDLVPLDDRLEPARAARFLVPEDSVGAPALAVKSSTGEVWTCDSRGVLRKFAASGRWALSKAMTEIPGEMGVSDLAVDRAGYLYIADRVGQRILVLGPDGRLHVNRALGGERVRWRPTALAVGPRRQIAIADPERGEIQILTPVPRVWTSEP
jgi:streptogramin lyase